MMNQKLSQLAGVVGLAGCLFVYTISPGDLSLIRVALLLLCIFAIYKQAMEYIKRLGPFIILLLFYDSFRGLAPSLTKHIEYNFMPHADRFLFGGLPTIRLQQWLWHGHVVWYDYLFVGAYMLHFALPVCLVILVWKTREKYYLEVVATYVFVAITNYVTFLILPAAPPWLAAQNGIVPPITRVMFKVWDSVGLHAVSASYDQLSPTVISAFPSMHAAFATLFLLFVTKIYGKKWGLVAAVYPILIWVGTVYMGEHYAIDEIAGIVYALIGYGAVYAALRYADTHRRVTIETAKG